MHVLLDTVVMNGPLNNRRAINVDHVDDEGCHVCAT